MGGVEVDIEQSITGLSHATRDFTGVYRTRRVSSLLKCSTLPHFLFSLLSSTQMDLTYHMNTPPHARKIPSKV